jgi:hypothetical protein
MGTTRRAARPQKPIETSLPPITVDYRDVAADAGFTAATIVGGQPTMSATIGLKCSVLGTNAVECWELTR